MKPFLLTSCAVMLASALPVWAKDARAAQDITCHFTTECVDTEACNATDYKMDIHYAAQPVEYIPADPLTLPSDPFTVEVSDATGDFKAAPLTDGRIDAPMTGFVAFSKARTQRLLTITDGIGRYSVHMRAEGMAIYYEGRCEEAQ